MDCWIIAAVFIDENAESTAVGSEKETTGHRLFLLFSLFAAGSGI
jgi:hypothetical protein